MREQTASEAKLERAHLLANLDIITISIPPVALSKSNFGPPVDSKTTLDTHKPRVHELHHFELKPPSRMYRTL